jgi:hypothetical protein
MQDPVLRYSSISYKTDKIHILHFLLLLVSEPNINDKQMNKSILGREKRKREKRKKYKYSGSQIVEKKILMYTNILILEKQNP